VRERLIAGLLLVAGISAAHSIAYADLFRCVGANGETLVTDSPCPSGTQSIVVTAASPAPTADVPRTFSQEELDRLLAPIALYPDALLAQILMASTYPLEVVQAARWMKAHPGLQGERLQAALDGETWDPSVKGLVAVPQVLTMMDEKLDWTQKLGDAFLAQQKDVMDTVQRLRARAQAAGNLASTPQQTVVEEGGSIEILPANPQVIYVPVYNPAVIYGPWWWPGPPYYWYPPGYVVAPAPFIYFGFGVVVGAAIWGACDWGHRTVIVNVPRYNAYNHTRIANPDWSHDVNHRKGVPYRDDAIRSKYRRALPGAPARQDFRGYQPAHPIAPAPSPSVNEIRQQLGRPVIQPPKRPESKERVAPTRGVPSPIERPRAAVEPVPPAFETFGRGEAARAYSNRGAASRAAPHSGAPAGAPGGHR